MGRRWASPGAAPRQDFALAVSNGVPTAPPPDGDEEAVWTTASMAFSG